VRSNGFGLDPFTRDYCSQNRDDQHFGDWILDIGNKSAYIQEMRHLTKLVSGRILTTSLACIITILVKMPRTGSRYSFRE
jgi:hypothetical protein